MAKTTKEKDNKIIALAKALNAAQITGEKLSQEAASLKTSNIELQKKMKTFQNTIKDQKVLAKSLDSKLAELKSLEKSIKAYYKKIEKKAFESEECLKEIKAIRSKIESDAKKASKNKLKKKEKASVREKKETFYSIKEIAARNKTGVIILQRDSWSSDKCVIITKIDENEDIAFGKVYIKGKYDDSKHYSLSGQHFQVYRGAYKQAVINNVKDRERD